MRPGDLREAGCIVPDTRRAERTGTHLRNLSEKAAIDVCAIRPAFSPRFQGLNEAGSGFGFRMPCAELWKLNPGKETSGETEAKPTARPNRLRIARENGLFLASGLRFEGGLKFGVILA